MCVRVDKRLVLNLANNPSYGSGSMAPFDLDACIQQLLHKQLLHEALLREICEKTKEVLMRESNVVHVSAPVTVVGDIHGCALLQSHHLRLVTLNHFSSQFYDLIEIFRIGGYAPYTNYLFLGALCLAESESSARAPIPYPSLVLQVTTSIEGSLVLKQYRSSHASSSDILIVCNSFEGITNLEP